MFRIAKLSPFVIIALIVSFTASCASDGKEVPKPNSTISESRMTTNDREIAYLAGGCYWCIEAVFQRLEGVDTVESGFTGGTVKNPSYKSVCEGTTGHAEVCKITFDPKVISFEEMLHVFFSAHDPTTLNRQGNDIGTQYRSAIFYTSDSQKEIATSYIKQLADSKTWSDSIVTEVSPLTEFYVAEDYHQNYYNQNESQSYCAFVVRPKVEKFMKKFSNQVKKEYK
ncbi:MAG: peptide-methionine (S)-S-oxide reductase MsrA [Ignavibacteria bacterium]|nr:peptide-methionine (S)-S-oxide reductase MsrA [Ignavibacteria bacterium]